VELSSKVKKLVKKYFYLKVEFSLFQLKARAARQDEYLE
jgi:hypothetical protein